MSLQNELSKMEQINYKQIKLMKSIYDDSYDDAELFIGNKGGKKYNNNYEEVKSVNKNNNNYVLKEGYTTKNAEEDLLKSINKGIDSKMSNSDNDILKDAFSVIMVIGITLVSWKNIIHKTTGAVDTTGFDKLIIVPVFNKIIEILKLLIKAADTAKNAYNTFKGMGNGKMFGGTVQNNISSLVGNISSLGGNVKEGFKNATSLSTDLAKGLDKDVDNAVKSLRSVANVDNAVKSLISDADLGAGLGAGLVNNILNTDDIDMFDIQKWSQDQKVTFWLILYIPLFLLSRFMIDKFSKVIGWFYNVKWVDIFKFVIFGKGTGDNLFPELGLYNSPKNPWLITVFSVYFVYLAIKVFIDYMTFWTQIPVFFLIFLCLWFGALMYPFLNICSFIFFVITAAYALFMPSKFYRDNGKWFPHSFMDTLNKELPGDENKHIKIFIDLTYRIFIFLSAIIFIYKSFKLSSRTLKKTYASISIIFTLIWLAFTWKEFSKSSDIVPEPNNH
jgi:hypothetical protein